MKRSVCLLLIGVILFTFPLSASARTYISDAKNVSAAAFTPLSKLALALQSIFIGDIDLYADNAFKEEISLPLGVSMSVSQQYYVPNGKGVTIGKQCFIYASAVYQKLFGETVGRGSNLTYSQILLSGGDSLSFNLLSKAGVQCGAYMRTTKKEDGSYDGYSGHSLVILFYDAESITYLEGNADNKGLIRITIESWDEFNATQLRGKGRYLCHIVQPTAQRMRELYGKADIYCSLGHTVQENWKTTVFPTVETGGEQQLYCDVCGELIEKRKIPPLADTAAIFEDVEKKDWFYKNNAVNYVYSNGIFKGISKTLFAPDTPMTRGMLVTVLGRMRGVDESYKKESNFIDVHTDKYYASYVAWAAKTGLVNGFQDGSFRPDENVTREQLCKVMALFCDLKPDTDTQEFDDDKDIANWAKPYVYACKKAGIVSGRPVGEGFVFDATQGATRAEVATILYNIEKTM